MHHKGLQPNSLPHGHYRPAPGQTSLQDALHEPHQAARDRIIAAFYANPRKSFQRWARRLSGCASNARFYVDPDQGKVRPWLNRCRHRVCPFCATSRSAHVAHQLEELLSKMKRPRAIILTVKSTDRPLDEQLRSLRHHFARLRRHKPWLERVKGGAYTVEITINKDTGLWHPHLHIIYDGLFMPFKLLQRLWHEITGHSAIVWIQDITARYQAAAELAKYIGKVQGIDRMNDEQLRTYARAVSGTRMVQTFGSVHGSQVKDQQPEPADCPNQYQVSIARLMHLAKRGAPTPANLLILIAERWRVFRGYIFHAMPQLEPQPTKHDRQARARARILGRPPPHHKPDSTPPDTEKLDARIFLTFTRYRKEDDAGAYAAFDLHGVLR